MTITCSLFPKMFKNCSIAELADIVHNCGLDTVNAVIRDGYWVTEEDLAESCAQFCQEMQRHGIPVLIATASSYPLESLAENPEPLRMLADQGITHVRIGWFKRSGPAAAAVDAARSCLARIAGHCETIGIKAMLQIHHGRLINNTGLAWYLARDLNPDAVGIMPDAGNQCHEGSDNWQQAMSLLGKHVAAIGIKSAEPYRDQKHWRRRWVPIDEGEADIPALIDACHVQQIDVPFIFLPFYHQNNPKLLQNCLKREVALLRQLAATHAAD